MKHIFIFLFFLAGCQKEGILQNANQPAALSFLHDGTQKEFPEMEAVRLIGFNSSHKIYLYSFMASKYPKARNYFSIQVGSDSLRAGFYTIDAANGVAIFREENAVCTSNVQGQNITLRVISNNGGAVQCRFYGTLYDQGKERICQITEGSFSARIRY